MRLTFDVDPAGGIRLQLLPRPLYIRVGVPRLRDLRLRHLPSGQQPNRKEPSSVSVQLQDDQEVDLTVEARDRAGTLVAVPGSLTWSVDNTDALVLTVDPADQTKATVTTTGVLAVTTVTVSDDTDGDPTTAEALGSISFEIVTGPVVQIAVSAGGPRAREVG